VRLSRTSVAWATASALPRVPSLRVNRPQP
jgi:hypothetical protein